jgi:hypothetical protein
MVAAERRVRAAAPPRRRLHGSARAARNGADSTTARSPSCGTGVLGSPRGGWRSHPPAPAKPRNGHLIRAAERKCHFHCAKSPVTGGRPVDPTIHFASPSRAQPGSFTADRCCLRVDARKCLSAGKFGIATSQDPRIGRHSVGERKPRRQHLRAARGGVLHQRGIAEGSGNPSWIGTCARSKRPPTSSRARRSGTLTSARSTP